MDPTAEPWFSPSFSDEKLATGYAVALEAVEQFATVLDHPHIGADVLAAQLALEQLHRRVVAAQLDNQGEIERQALHRLDGHRSVQAHTRHVLGISGAEAYRRCTAARSLRDLPEVRAALREGRISPDHVQVITSIHRNPRIKAKVPGEQARFLRLARDESFADFADRVRDWARIADLDGGFKDRKRHHDNRNFRFIENSIEGTWEPFGHFASDQGARMHEIHQRYLQAEYEADWAEARAKHGDAATLADLRRTDAQRRADALERIFADAAGAPPGTTAPKIVHNIVWSADTYLALAGLLGADADRLDPHWSANPTDPGAQRNLWCDPDTYRCSTLDGVPLDPIEQFFSSLVNHVRRVVITTKGVVIDLGRTARLFTGSARTAAQLQHPHCVWPGCDMPTTRCEVDHLHDYTKGGLTNPDNGAPLCGFHNRWKQKKFAVQRDPDTGRWRTYRPDGTVIP